MGCRRRDGQDQLPNTARSIQWYDPSGDTVQKMENAHGVLIDSFLVSPAQIERIRTINSCLAIIDDYYRRRYESGVVIDWTIGAENFAYPSKVPGVIYLLGSDYCAIRPDFNNAPTRRFQRHQATSWSRSAGRIYANLRNRLSQCSSRNFHNWKKTLSWAAG